MLEGLEELVGAWELRSCTTTKPGGQKHYVFGPNPRGVIMYTPDGWMSCHMAGSEGTADGTDTVRYSGYHGPVIMRPDDRVVEHHVRGSTHDWMIGTVQERAYRIDGDTLHLSAEMNGDQINVIWSRDRKAN
ncbi:MAG: lipocalin-like domain-containing protein [Sphingomonadaceae bacterium]|nr:lipocalin-like domain-containing protein [Sphingomonadaceae bacterium]